MKDDVGAFKGRCVTDLITTLWGAFADDGRDLDPAVIALTTVGRGTHKDNLPCLVKEEADVSSTWGTGYHLEGNATAEGGRRDTQGNDGERAKLKWRERGVRKG